MNPKNANPKNKPEESEVKPVVKTPPPPPTAPKPKLAITTEKLLAFSATVSFSDGNLREAMEKYGYECEWKMNEVRKLPKWLIQRCIQSGAELDRADG